MSQPPELADRIGGSRNEMTVAGVSDHRLDRAFSAERVAPDAFTAEISPEWMVLRGPNGGYLAGLLLATIIRRVDDPARRPRALTVHYPSVPRPGAVEIRARIERAGRSVTWVSAEMHQGGSLCVTARAALSTEWPSIHYSNAELADVPPPENGFPLPDGLPPYTRNYEYRSLFATPVTPKTHDKVGGWIRPRGARRYDAPALAAITDAWFPVTLAYDERFTMAASLDLTVYFRDYAAIDALAGDAFLLSVFRSRLAAEGFFEEDGELWSPAGQLLAQSRQLAIASPL